MKIALLNRDETTHVGGDAIQLRGYQAALKKLGHEADYLSALDPELRGYGEAWLFHVNFSWCVPHYLAARSQGIPVRLFPIYYTKSHKTCGMAEQGVFLYAKDIYALSETEVFEMVFEMDLPGTDKFHVIPNGVDKGIFYDRGLERKYVMTAGRYESYKGHLRVAEAANAMGLPFLTVGAVADNDPEVQNQCRAICGPDSLVLDVVTQDELAKLYSQARVYVCGSNTERNNLTILEAAACGATVVNSVGNRGHGWLSAPVMEPTKPEELQAAIQEAWQNPHNYAGEVRTWDSVIEEILGI
jgi:glycosyltransferase involved in cell wall biosynthesis